MCWTIPAAAQLERRPPQRHGAAGRRTGACVVRRLRAVGGWIERHARRMALGIWLLCLLLLGIAVVLDVLILLGRAPGGPVAANDLISAPESFVMATFGALIVARWPRQVMGWLFSLSGLLGMLSWPPSAYEQFAGAEPLPLLDWVVWLGHAIGFSHLLILLMIVPYLFPNGRLLSRRWRALLAIASATIVVDMLNSAFAVRLIGIDDRQENANPARVEALAVVIDSLSLLAVVAIPLAWLGGIASLLLRFRRSRGVERAQIRWIAWMLGLTITLVGVFLLLDTVAQSWIRPNGNWTLPGLALALTVVVCISIGIPAVLGLSILRYRLYSIDRLINRTVVYGALTVGLGALYWGSVVLFQQVLDPLSGSSSLAVAGSTLTIAGLFRPARSRVQRLVDRRFYRRKYDAARAIEGFSAHLREELDLNTLEDHLQTVVHGTMQPAHVSVWLRPLVRPSPTVHAPQRLT